MKVIDILKQYPIYWINLDKDTERKNKMESLFDSLDLKHTRISGVQCNSVLEGCAKSQLKILEQFEPPFTILEDDCGLVSSDILDLDLFDTDVDCLYLGMSRWGMPMNGNGYAMSKLSKPTYAEKTNIDGLIKIHHMLSTHAITYISKKYTNNIISKIKEYQEIPHHCDVGCAEVQEDYNVYALNPPLFYQDEPKNAPWTNFKLTFDIPSGV
jgi:hypothetical protein